MCSSISTVSFFSGVLTHISKLCSTWCVIYWITVLSVHEEIIERMFVFLTGERNVWFLRVSFIDFKLARLDKAEGDLILILKNSIDCDRRKCYSKYAVEWQDIINPATQARYAQCLNLEIAQLQPLSLFSGITSASFQALSLSTVEVTQTRSGESPVWNPVLQNDSMACIAKVFKVLISETCY